MAFPVNKEMPPDYSEDNLRDNRELIDSGTRLRASKWWKFGGGDRSFVPIQATPSKSSLASSHEDSYGWDENNADSTVFSDARAAEIYKPIEKFEGRHRFDLHATWSEDEEKKLVRRVSLAYSRVPVAAVDICEKLDRKVALWACVMFFALQLDRGNIVQALSTTFLGTCIRLGPLEHLSDH